MKKTRLLNISILISLIGVIGYTSCRPRLDDHEDSLPEIPFVRELDTAIEQVLAENGDHDLGISAAMVLPGFNTWAGASGISHYGTPISEDMLFDIGSVQKNFEAALVLLLAEEGVISLDDPISMYLPALPNVDSSITIRQLLNHTSGVFNVFEHPDFPWVRMDVDYAKEWTVEEVFDSFVLEPYGPPGYAQHYSSTNYLLITKVIEAVAGSTVPEEISHRFLDPLGLENTYISMGELPPENYTTAHPWVDIDQDGTLDDLHGIPKTWIATLTHPVMFSTCGDLVYWINALFHEGSILSAGSMGEMLEYPAVAIKDPDGGTYGLGVVYYSNFSGLEVLGHGGSSLGYSAAALYIPEFGISLAWLINTGESPVELAGRLMSQTLSVFSEILISNLR